LARSILTADLHLGLTQIQTCYCDLPFFFMLVHVRSSLVYMMYSFWLIEDVARRGRLFHYHMMGALSTVAFERHGADMAMIAPDSVEVVF